MLSVQRFYEWQSPTDMLLRNGFHGITLGHHKLRRIGREFRESFIAAHFAQHRQAKAVCLLRPGNKATPDFAIRVGAAELWYEITEADRPGRKRGEEELVREPKLLEDHEWTSSEDYFGVVKALSEKKACKQYARCEGLIIYDNAWPIIDPEAMTEVWWRNATAPARATFQEIWIASDGFRQIS